MAKEHETIPNEPQESPVTPSMQEIQHPSDPHTRDIPKEAPQNEPREVPEQPTKQPETKPDQTGSYLNQTEV